MWPINDEIKNRLAGIGRYQIAKRSFLDRLFRSPTALHWPSPAGVENDWTRFALRFCLDVPRRDAAAGFEKLLAGWEAFRERLPEYLPQLKQYLVELFRGCYWEELAPYEKAEYLGADLQLSNQAILKHAHDGTVGFSWDGRKLTQQVWFEIEWDPEHGATVEFDELGNIIKPWAQPGSPPSDPD